MTNNKEKPNKNGGGAVNGATVSDVTANGVNDCDNSDVLGSGSLTTVNPKLLEKFGSRYSEVMSRFSQAASKAGIRDSELLKAQPELGVMHDSSPLFKYNGKTYENVLIHPVMPYHKAALFDDEYSDIFPRCHSVNGIKPSLEIKKPFIPHVGPKDCSDCPKAKFGEEGEPPECKHDIWLYCYVHIPDGTNKAGEITYRRINKTAKLKIKYSSRKSWVDLVENKLNGYVLNDGSETEGLTPQFFLLNLGLVSHERSKKEFYASIDFNVYGCLLDLEAGPQLIIDALDSYKKNDTIWSGESELSDAESSNDESSDTESSDTESSDAKGDESDEGESEQKAGIKDRDIQLDQEQYESI